MVRQEKPPAPDIPTSLKTPTRARHERRLTSMDRNWPTSREPSAARSLDLGKTACHGMTGNAIVDEKHQPHESQENAEKRCPSFPSLNRTPLVSLDHGNQRNRLYGAGSLGDRAAVRVRDRAHMNRNVRAREASRVPRCRDPHAVLLLPWRAHAWQRIHCDA